MTPDIHEQDPARPLVHKGLIQHWGQFSRPLLDVDLLDARWPSPGSPMPRPARRLRLKQWQHIGIVHPCAWFGLVVFDAGGTMGVSFVTVSPWGDPARHLDIARSGPPWRVHVAPSIWQGQCRARWPGYDVRIVNDLRHAHHRVHVRTGGNIPVHMDLVLHQRFSEVDPLVVLHPVSPNRPFYTHKAPLAAEGEIRVGDRSYRLEPDRDVALLDEQKTFYPWRWFWRWATLAGTSTCGKRIAVNACHNVLDDVADPARTENGVWVDGRLVRTGPVRFRFDPDAPEQPWRITGDAGALDLTFSPEGVRVGDHRVGGLGSRFRQPWGTFRGCIPDGRGGRLELLTGHGVCEQQDVIG